MADARNVTIADLSSLTSILEVLSNPKLRHAHFSFLYKIRIFKLHDRNETLRQIEDSSNFYLRPLRDVWFEIETLSKILFYSNLPTSEIRSEQI